MNCNLCGRERIEGCSLCVDCMDAIERLRDIREQLVPVSPAADKKEPKTKGAAVVSALRTEELIQMIREAQAKHKAAERMRKR